MFSVVHEGPVLCSALCPFLESCRSGESTACRSRSIVLKTSGASPTDELQIARDLLRAGLVVFSCRKVPAAEGGALFHCVCAA
jgi:hypothetical protein